MQGNAGVTKWFSWLPLRQADTPRQVLDRTLRVQAMRMAMLLVGLVTPLVLRGAESASNAVPWIAPSNGMATARWPYRWKSPFAIATNTPAFEEYGLRFMLDQANEIRERWRLDIPEPLTTNNVYSAACPTIHGIEGHLMTDDQRFHWNFDRNILLSFSDRHYFAPSFRYHDGESARLAKIKSQITAKEAEAIARDALQKLLGANPQQLKLRKRAEVNQYKFEESDGKVYPLPLFDVRWRVAGPKRYAAQNLEYTPLRMEVSGITKNVVNYHHSQRLDVDSPVPRTPLPTNYFQMLNLPENYLDTVPESKRRLWGLPPGTSSPVDATNASQSNVRQPLMNKGPGQ